MDDIKELAEEIDRNDFMLAALHHKSARKSASNKLDNYNLDDRVIDAWESCGKSIISLYSACRAVDVAEKNSGACSLVERKIRVCVYERLGTKIRLTNKEKFGGGVSSGDKNSVEVSNSLTNQLVGSIQYNLGYSRLSNEFFGRFLSLDSVDVAPEKDSKTQLQEYCQSVNRQLPSYSLLQEVGPAHSRSFKVRVNALGFHCEGVGLSKRLAELKAAENFIVVQSIKVGRKSKPVNVNKIIDYVSVAKLMQSPPNARRVGLIVEKLKLPAWSISLVGLALTHRSYSSRMPATMLGKSNAVLAFLGANVIEWLTFDMVIRHFSLDELSKAGGIREIVRLLVNQLSISKLYDELLTVDALLLGPGQKALTQATKGEFIQALFGVLFLVKRDALECAKNLIDDIPIFLEYFIHRPLSMELSRDEIVPVKTLFQERCQLLGLRVKFVTDMVLRNQQRIATPSIILESDYIDYPLRIEGDVQLSRIEGGTPNVILESEIALKNKNIFDAILCNEPFPTFESGQNLYVKWAFEHSISLAGNAGEKNGTLRISKLISKNFLGVDLLRGQCFAKFEEFIFCIDKFIGVQADGNKAGLLKYYGYAGRSLVSNSINNLSRTIGCLEAELIKADPLQESHDLQETSAFKSFISEATTYRLKSGGVTFTSLGGVVEEFKLLQRGKANIICRADFSERIIEIDGSHLYLLDILKGVSSSGEAVKIEIDVEDGELCLVVVGFTEEEQEALLLLPAWSELKVILPITSLVVSDSGIKISISSVFTGGIRELSLEFWWQYHFKDPYEVAANDRIASILHDVKNSILGYCFTSAHARNKSSGRERYLLAADASGHLDTAVAGLRFVKSFSEETGSVNISPMKISSFIKSMMSELWSWMPSSVNLIFTPCDSQLEICTDEHRLRSLITNVVKNSVEAMAGSGSIYISYSIEMELEGVEFVVSDVGPGFNGDQLVALESGVPLKTSKSSGHGIGLMAVMLTAKELGGNIVFSNGEDVGAIVKVWVPSIHKFEA